MTLIKTVFRTDRGKVRTHNEDYVGVFPKINGQLLAVVADGMGGHAAGDVASSMAANFLKELWEKCKDLQTPDETEKWLQKAIAEVNQQVFQHANSNKDLQGMGTTIVAAICTEKFATIANVGDSRCYSSNQEGLKQITYDHSLVNELVKIGQISKEDAEHHPRKNVLLRAVGTEASVEADIHTISFEEGDYLLLCSDGLTNKISNQEINEILNDGQLSIDQKADQMKDLAIEYGGEDNITLIIIYQTATEKAGV